jgi:hypothetical protein
MSAPPERKDPAGGRGLDRRSANQRQDNLSTNFDKVLPSQIVISTAGRGQGCSVRIEPPLSDGRRFDADFKTRKEAYGYASGLRLCNGWPILGLTTKPKRKRLGFISADADPAGKA